MPMRQSAEIAIVGAGPAGARAAELLAGRGTDVLLLDPKAPWEKPCGGGLTPALFHEMPELTEVQPLARPIGTARVETGGVAPLDVALDDDIWMISREVLGRWQLDRAVRAGARHAPAKVQRIRRTSEGWQLDTSIGAVEAEALVGADGAASAVRNAAAPTFAIELLPTRVAYPPGAGPTPDVLLLRFYRDLAGYLWDFPRPDHRSVGIEGSRGSRSRNAFDSRIDECRDRSWPDEETGLARAGAVIGTAQLGHGDFSCVAGNGFALLGDAAGFADPFTGEGIRNALRSASLFAEAWGMGPDWKDTYRALARDAFAMEFATSRVLRKWLIETGVGVRLLRRATSSRLAHALVATTLNSASVHDYRVGRLLGRWRRGLQNARRWHANPPGARVQS
jgi:geranylgeranyl diphosphate/geranylgeranyl-bacteriochlorophyllide a reductase